MPAPAPNPPADPPAGPAGDQRTPPAGTPVVDLPLDEAIQELTGFEVLEIEKHFGRPMEQLGGTSLLIGAVVVFEKRAGRSPSWQVVKGRSMKQLSQFFADESVDPDDEQGKG